MESRRITMPRFEKSRANATRSSLLVIVLGLGILSCGDPVESPAPQVSPADQAASTRRMAEALAALERRTDPRTNDYRADLLVELYEGIEPPPDRRSQLQMRAHRASALLHDGRTDDAIGELDAVLTEAEARSDLFKPAFIQSLRELLAIAFLRLGEQRNCFDAHQAESCLMPLRGGGVHHDPNPAREAARRYRELLEEAPGDLSLRWLLNIATMAAEGSVASLPAPWRLPDDAFPEDPAILILPDIAPQLGLDLPQLAGGTVVDDLDGDGLLDLMASSWRLDHQLRLFRSRGDGTFADITTSSGLQGITGGLNLVHADYDNDGDNDVFVLRGAWLGEGGQHPNSLLRNNGQGADDHLTFEDVTVAAGVWDAFPTQTAAWADFDGDGNLDLFVGAETVGHGPSQVHPCRLYRSLGDGSFEEVGRETGTDVVGFVKAAIWGDIDNDGRPDLYLSRLGQPNLMLHNDGPDGTGRWRFSNIAAAAGVREPRNSFPAWFWDIDNDGWLDLFVSGYPAEILSGRSDGVAADFFGEPSAAARPRLYRNLGSSSGGSVRFEDVTAEWGLDKVLFTMGSNFGDLDNDGWPDAYLGTGAPDYRALMPNRLFRNRAGSGFDDVTWSTRTGHLQKGHGVAFADLDNDGDQDIYAVMGGAFSGDLYPNALFENPGYGGHWITLRLEGVLANRSAIGARIQLTLTTEHGDRRQVHARVGTGGSFGSASLQQEIGLANSPRIDRLRVTWPGSGTVQTFDDVAGDRVYALREDLTELRVIELPRLHLGGDEGGASTPHRHDD